MAISIEKDVPLPPIHRPRQRKYPLDDMEPGDSFLAEGMTMQSIRGSIGQYERKSGRKFTARSSAEGVRVWRVE